MSAYMVDDKTINKIISFLQNDSNMKWYMNGLKLDTDEQCEELGKQMFDLNVSGVNSRYGEKQAETFRPLDYQYKYELPDKPIQALKSLQCFLYQCSEGDVVEMQLYKTLTRFERAIMSHIIASLPEYDQAKWA